MAGSSDLEFSPLVLSCVGIAIGTKKIGINKKRNKDYHVCVLRNTSKTFKFG